jgi:putative DNA primase/helicase
VGTSTDSWLLVKGSLSQKEVEELAKGAGISWRTIERAKAKAGVESEKDGLMGWTWKLKTAD